MTTRPPSSGGQEPPQASTAGNGTDGGSDSTTGSPASAEYAEHRRYDRSGRGDADDETDPVGRVSEGPKRLSDRLTEYRAARQLARDRPWYPSLDEPLEVRMEKAKVLFDGRRLTIEREQGHDNPGSESIPVHQIASVAIGRAKPGEPEPRHDRLVVELTNGRSTYVELGYQSRRQAKHLQDEVSRAAAQLPLTGRRPPRGGINVGLIVFLLVVVAMLLIAVLN